ncbi:MAG: S28 family serine protease [Pseudomonadota bacterium]
MNYRIWATAICLLFGLGLLSPNAHADLKEYYYQRYLKSLRPIPKNLNTVSSLYNQKIDPSNPADERTFTQRYYINSEAAQGPKSPVLFYICGEATCEADSLEYGAIVAWAKKLGAHRVALEHRYYGKSQPFSKMTPDNLQYLKMEYALEDLASFERFAILKYNLPGPWIAIGGSYPGSLSAFYHQRYPELTVGALASSAPVQARANFEEYDLAVSLAAGPDCAQEMREVVSKIEQSLKNKASLESYKIMFDAQEVRDPVDFLYVVADMAAVAIQYGNRDYFCNSIQTATNPVKGYADAGKELFRRFGITAVGDSSQGAESENPNDYLSSFGMRAWYYQSCTEFGYWQIAHHDPKVSVRSSLIDLNFHQQLCKRLFGIDKPVDDAATNRKFYQLLLESKTKNILFTNGSVDPWSYLSISHLLGNDTNPQTSAFVIDGSAHCADLGTPKSTDSTALKKARSLFEQLTAGWANLSE